LRRGGFAPALTDQEVITVERDTDNTDVGGEVLISDSFVERTIRKV